MNSATLNYEEVYKESVQLAQTGRLKEALQRLNVIPSEINAFAITELRAKILWNLRMFEKAYEVIDRDLERLPYQINTCELLFDFMRNDPKRTSDSTSDSKNRLVIYDRIFPNLKCSFTTTEFNAYLERFSNSVVYTTCSDFICMGGDRRSFEQVDAAYTEQFPKLRGRAVKINSQTDFRGKLLYTLFLRNIFQIIGLVEKFQTPFIFTLYSGGDYGMEEPKSDAMLKRVFSSPCFRKVIVIERVTRDYLLSNGFVREDQIEFVYGPITNSKYLVENAVPKRYFPKDKSTFDICFVAHKHSPMGRDKGYDIFVQVAKNLYKKHPNIHFHVVGGFDEKEIDVRELQGRIHFYGTQPSTFFPKFHSQMDVILSPCLPFLLQKGAFDGAPNVSTVEAGLCGVAIFVTDQLKQNTMHTDRKHLVTIPHDAWVISDLVEHYYQKPSELYAIADAGRKHFEKVYSYESQLKPRIQLLEKYME